MVNYLISYEDTFDPRGPDKKGWNRLVLGGGNMISTLPHCMLRPLTWQGAWGLYNRVSSQNSPSQFGYCNSDGNCTECPLTQVAKTNYKPVGLSVGVVREYDADGSVWLLNRRDRGWGEFGFRYKSWADFVQSENVALGRRKRDEHGFYFEVFNLSGSDC